MNDLKKDSLEYLHGQYVVEVEMQVKQWLNENLERSNRKSKLKILSVDGGGIRGLTAAIIVQQLEKDFGKPAYEIFDLMVGSSTGGIIAIGLSLGVPAEKLVKLYKSEGATIFN